MPWEIKYNFFLHRDYFLAFWLPTLNTLGGKRSDICFWLVPSWFTMETYAVLTHFTVLFNTSLFACSYTRSVTKWWKGNILQNKSFQEKELDGWPYKFNAIWLKYYLVTQKPLTSLIVFVTLGNFSSWGLNRFVQTLFFKPRFHHSLFVSFIACKLRTVKKLNSCWKD